MAIRGIDPSFGLDNFNQAKYKSESETIADSLLALLFGKPGYFPAMPNLGIDIQKTLYMTFDEIVPEKIKADIVSQCSVFKSYIDEGSIMVDKAMYKGQPLLLITIPVTVKNSAKQLVVGVTSSSNGAIKYNYEYM